MSAGLLMLGLAALALGGCASRPEIARIGDLTPGSFAFAAAEDAAPSPERQRLEALVAERLAPLGLKPAPLAQADYLADVGVSSTPRGMGVYLPSPQSPNQAPTATGQDWRVAPVKGLWGRGEAQRFTISLADRRTGKITYQASVTLRAKSAQAAALEPGLIAAALTPAPAPNRP